MFDLNIQKLDVWQGRDIYMLREDLLPVACGGNKVRIACKLIEDAIQKGSTAIVGYGNSRSNLCRVLSMLCTASHLRCVIVSPSDEDGSVVETTNSKIVEHCGAEVVKCDKKSNIAAVVDGVLKDLIREGETPYYIFGSKFGTGNEKVLTSAYEEVARGIMDWELSHGIRFDQIALAVGTGSTYAGILNGFRRAGRSTPILGYTIAREMDRCVAALGTYTSYPVSISDIAINGGYGKSSLEEDEFLSDVLRTKAILLDSTYSGKALWGLNKEFNADMGTTLFIHTGSLPLAIDGLHRK